MSMTQKTQDTVNFESALEALEIQIEKMGNGQFSLEESLKAFEEGISLARRCQQNLKDAEQKVQILIEKNGSTQTEPFAIEE